MTRLWLRGSAVRIKAVNDLPECFTWQGRIHRIEAITRRWRVNVGWWRFHIWRDYFNVTTDTGLYATLYHSLLDDTWALQRLYD